MLFTDLFTVLLSGDETEGQFGIITADSPAGDIIPTHSHNETHETFYVLDGKVRLFYAGRRGRQALRAAHPGRLRLRAGRLRARLQDRGGRPHDGHPLRRLRAVLPAHGHRRPTTPPRTSRRSSRTSRACRPPRSSTTCSSSRPATTGRTPRATDPDADRPPEAEAQVPCALSLRSRRAVPTPALPLPPPAHELPLPAAHPAPVAPGCSPACPYAAIPGIRPLELDLVPAAGVRRPGAGRRLPARRRLAAGQPARRRSGVPRRVPDALRAGRAGGHRRRQRRLPALRRGDLAGPAARREGRRPLAARPGRRARHRPGRGSPPGASRPAATSPSCSA